MYICIYVHNLLKTIFEEHYTHILYMIFIFVEIKTYFYKNAVIFDKVVKNVHKRCAYAPYLAKNNCHPLSILC